MGSVIELAPDTLSILSADLQDKEGKLEEAAIAVGQIHIEKIQAEQLLADRRTDVEKLRRAIAVLSGEEPAVAPAGPEPIQATAPLPDGVLPVDPAPAPAPVPAPQAYIDPVSLMPCSGCGEVGQLRRTMRNIKGRPVNMIVCGDCGNEIPQG